MQEEIQLNGKKYLSLRRAAAETDLSHNYLSRLCREKVVDALREKSGWYVETVSIKAYLSAQEHAREYRRKDLIEKSSIRYQESRKLQTERLFAASRAAEHEPVPHLQINMREHVRRAMEKGTETTVASLSESARMPGVLQAAAHLPAQMAAHVPTHMISPGVELLHRVIALTSALALVFGTYSLFNPTFARMAYDSSRGTLAVAVRAVEDPSLAFNTVRGQVGASYAATASLAADIAPHSNSAMAASAAAPVSPSPQPLIDVIPDSQQLAAAATTMPLASASGTTQGAEQPIAISVKFTGSKLDYGDIIAFNSKNGLYTLSGMADDANAYGIVVEEPALLFKSDDPGDISIARSGPALVNVTLEDGPISIGDALTSSSIPGKAKRAQTGDHVIGVAGEAFTGGGVMLATPDGKRLASGTIKVNVTFEGGTDAGKDKTQESCSSLTCKLFGAIDIALVRALTRYMLSGVIAALTLTLAFKSFMSDANYGVISMGRNPLAKSSIQSMVVFNAVLTLAIASAGLFAAMVVLFAG